MYEFCVGCGATHNAVGTQLMVTAIVTVVNNDCDVVLKRR